MRVTRLLSAFILFVALSALPLAGQEVKEDLPAQVPFVALTDPACPVNGYATPVPAPGPATKEIRVLYFPMGRGATIKEPKSPILHLVFNDGFFSDDNQTLPFVRQEDGVWLATVALLTAGPAYAIYWIEDRGSKQVDTNDGKYFEVPFCNIHGQRSGMSVKFEAQSYTGILEAHGIERSVNYAKAIEVLEDYIRVPSKGQSLISSLWRYKLALRGDTPEARSTLLAEINGFIRDHSDDGFGLTDALNFAAYQNWIPPETMESLVKAIENKYPDFDSPRAFVIQARAAREKDKAIRITLLWEVVDKYPNSPDAIDARKRLLLEVTDLSQREKLYQQIRSKDPYDAFEPLNMARMYLQANQKLPEALALLDEADKLFDENAVNKRASVHFTESGIRDSKHRIAITRADILVRLGKPAEALSILLPLKGEFTLGSSYYILGRALEDTGDERAAVDAYLESAVRPWGEQQQASAALERLWLREKLGNKKDLQQRIEARTAQNFSNAIYVPRVLGHPAPEFDLTTLQGEHLSNSQLRGKIVILDFWATWCGPCLWELKALQDFQEQHPQVVVLTVVSASTDAKQLEEVVRKRKLTSLRISQASSELWEQFGASGVPNTFVIDETGEVRIQHLGGLPDVSRYLGADLKAIAEAGPAKQVDQPAAR